MNDNNEVLDAEVIGEETGDTINTESAFIAYLDENGHWVADGDLSKKFNVARDATVEDFFHASAVINKDITVADTTRQLIVAQQRVAQQMAQQMEAQKVAQNLGGGIDLSKLRA